jgi:hypothetical protein
MNTHPILFSGEMVLAILEGRKTQTRRIVKGNPNGKIPFTDELPCPYGLTGDTLWVREKWNAQTQNGKWWHEVKREDRPLLNWAWTNPVKPAFDGTPSRWLPSIHMPREASRITLKITQLRIEKLQSITHDEAIAEGFYQTVEQRAWGRLGFSLLWDKLNKDRGYGWDANPLVWVVSFEPITAAALGEAGQG